MTHEDIEATKAPLMEHLIELRSRLIKALIAFAITFALCFYFAKTIYNILVWPFVLVAGVENSKFIYTALLEYFVTQLKLAMFGAAFLSFPIVAAQIYMFVAPGLYRNERHAFLPYFVATPFFFALGATLVYFIVLPLLVRFSLGMQQGGEGVAEIALLPKVGEYLSLDDEPDLCLRHRLPIAGDPDAARARRHHHLATAEGKTPLFHRRRLRAGRRADAARCHQSALACAAAPGSLRGLDLVGALGGEEGEAGCRHRRARSQAGGMKFAFVIARLDRAIQYPRWT